jgi:hypothetical protein
MADALEALRFRFAPTGIALPDLPPAPSDAPSVVAMSLHKAGSTLLYDLLRGLAPLAGLAFVSVQDHFFRAGLAQKDLPAETASLFLPRGYCYGGFRGAPPFDIPILPSARSVILVRDPRDMAVSEFYSITRSHVIPPPSKDGTQPHFLALAREKVGRRGLDQHVVAAARGIERQFERLQVLGLFQRPNVAIYRYEDVIFRKREWVADLCAWYGWDIAPADRQARADRFDIVPAVPDPDAHIRQVHPGSHRRELRPETVATIDGILDHWLRLFRYA